MKRVVIFTAPKPFLDPHIRTIQRNAIQSWSRLGDGVDVLVIGEEPGLRDAVEDLDVLIIPEVERNDLGTPLINSIFNQARKHSPGELLLYVNADIILLPDTLEVIGGVDRLVEEYLLVGKRWDLDVSYPVSFEPGWADALRDRLEKEGRRRKFTAIDFFIFPRQQFHQIPPFAVGRAGWDNWMIFHAMQENWQVIDLTPSLDVVHQNHDYRHLPQGKPHYDLEESFQNVSLGGGMPALYDLLDVKYHYQDGEIRRIGPTLPRLLRKLERIVTPEEQEGLRWSLTRILRKTRRRLS